MRRVPYTPLETALVHEAGGLVDGGQGGVDQAAHLEEITFKTRTTRRLIQLSKFTPQVDI